MKNFIKVLIIVLLGFAFNYSLAYAAGTSNSNESKYKSSLYKQGKKLVLKAKKFEKKNRKEDAEKIYLKALKVFEKAYAENKKNADILNYLGFTLRKTGNFEKAEIFYLKGLEIEAEHLGINEYLGELYVQTNRIELAKKRLAVLDGCKCEEYEELKELIENN